jgi:hypothetical protein
MWSKVDGITYKHTPTGMQVIKMADNTWSVCTGPIEEFEIGLTKWVSHKYRTLRDAKQAVTTRAGLSEVQTRRARRAAEG